LVSHPEDKTQKKVLRICGPKTEEITGAQKNMHAEEVHNFHF
jgi:hypothetical protein